MENLSILVLDDEQGYRDGLQDLLKMKGYQVQTAALPSEALSLLDKNSYDILLLDLGMPEMDGIEVLKNIKHNRDEMEVIIITGHADMEHSIAALRAGASDFIAKPFRGVDIEKAIERTRKYAEIMTRLKDAEQSLAALTETLKKFGGTALIGKSQAMVTVMKEIEKVSAADETSVLIFGESGTGKELVARGIHAMSKRRDQYFHSVNCAAVPETLFESEFFGYQKGAFTGANETLPGWFEISDKGTLFLDEISGMPLHLQTKLLRVLDQRSITRLGSHKEVLLNLRFISATNQGLEQMVSEGKFRNDLYHRLATFKIYLPPLRERKEDIPLLVEHFISMFNLLMAGKIKGIEDNALADLMQYHFPGNVRELKNMVERAFILSDGKTIRRKDLLVPASHGPDESGAAGMQSLKLEEIEQDIIRKALKQAKNNKSGAAQILGITRQALDRRMEKFGIRSQNNHNGFDHHA